MLMVSVRCHPQSLHPRGETVSFPIRAVSHGPIPTNAKLMPLSPKLSAEQLAVSFAEIAPRYSEQQALVESSRCLFCFDAPCITACPTGIDIPAFIKKISSGNVAGAARVILSANILGASCARVCPTEVLCEGACVMLDRDRDPIKIGRLQRYATDHAYEKKIQIFQNRREEIGQTRRGDRGWSGRHGLCRRVGATWTRSGHL